MGKPPAPDTIAVRLPEPTGHDGNGFPFWRVGPILLSIDTLEHGQSAEQRHGVFVYTDGPIPEGSSPEVAAALLAAGKAVQAANTRALDELLTAAEVDA